LAKTNFSILLSQLAGLIGTIFTFNAIPTWYATLARPFFAPPNWLFGPIWTILYTLIGISLYLIWTSKKGSLKLFFFHLFLNAIWSPIFFGSKDLGLAFFVILLMDVTLIVIIRNFYKVNKIAALILIPYLLWITFATILNFSFWQLNPKTIKAQDSTFTESKQDYVLIEDTYKSNLFEFNFKKGSYQKNPTLSLKEEARISLYKFINSRNDLIRSYLNMVKSRSSNENVFSKIESEISWFNESKSNYSETENIEIIINKSKEEDQRFEKNTLPVIYFSLANINLNNIKSIKNSHIQLYENLKNESKNIVALGRADASLFERWFKDIDEELNTLSQIESKTQSMVDKILASDEYERSSAYKRSLDEIEPARPSLLKLNQFVRELENTLESKR